MAPSPCSLLGFARTQCVVLHLLLAHERYELKKVVWQWGQEERRQLVSKGVAVFRRRGGGLCVCA